MLHARHLPAPGETGIFNHSRYEEVLVVRLHPEILDRQKLPRAAKKGDPFEHELRPAATAA